MHFFQGHVNMFTQGKIHVKKNSRIQPLKTHHKFKNDVYVFLKKKLYLCIL